MARSRLLHDRTAAAIIDGAAQVLAEHGPAASMELIASSVGIGRATLYRYFPNRDDLLTAMAAASIEDLAARIRDAGLERVPFEEAVARLTRAIIAAGSKYAALSGGGVKHTDAYPGVNLEIAEPIRALFRRGVAEGAVRAELPADLLLDLFSGLMRGALEATTVGGRGVEETAAAVTDLFLGGTRGSDAGS